MGFDPQGVTEIVEHGIPRGRVDKQPTKVPLNIYLFINNHKMEKQEAECGCLNTES